MSPKQFLFLAGILAAVLSGCADTRTDSSVHIAVFIPGVTSGNAVYQMLADGVRAAAGQYNSQRSPPEREPVKVSVIEAGTNQAEWPSKLTAVAAAGNYDVIISSNPSMPDIAVPLTRQFPQQRFILLDAYCPDNPNIAAVRYNQREQAYLTGYIAGLATTASSMQMPLANDQKKIGLIAAQEYPVMNDIILPSFTEGAHAADKDIQIDFRVVGNWYDASKAAELARSLYRDGSDVILPIAGGASQGVVAAAQELGFYIVWFDENGFSKAPGYVISSAVMNQKKMAQEITLQFLEGKTEFGVSRTVGIAEGYVDFIQDDPLYISSVDKTLRGSMTDTVEAIKNGSLQLPSP